MDYKLEEEHNFQSRINALVISNDHFCYDSESSLQEESNSNSKSERILIFLNLITKLKDNPTTFTLVKIIEYLKKPEIKDCSKMIDEQVIQQLFNLAAGDDDNIKQNSFFTIGSIILNFPEKIVILFQYNIIMLLSVSLLNSNNFYASSIYFVINCLILKSVYFQQSFFNYFEFDFLFQKAYKFISEQNNDMIVECFSSIAKYIEISNKEQALKLLQIFSFALAKKLSPTKDRIEMNSYHFALVGIINFLNYQNIPSIDKKSIIEDSNISLFLQFFFEFTELTPEIINATILASQLYSLDISNIPNILPRIVRVLKFSRLDQNFHIIIHCIDIIIQIGNDQVFYQLIYELNLVGVIFEIMLDSNIETKIKIYSCFNSIILRLPAPEYDIVINNDFIGYLFNLIELDNPDFTEKVISDIYRIFQVAEEIGAFEKICFILDSMSAKFLIEDVLQKDEISEKSRSCFRYIYDQITENEV